MELVNGLLAEYSAVITKYGNVIAVRTQGGYFLFDKYKRKVLLSATPEGIFVEDQIPENLKRYAYTLLEDSGSELFEHQFDRGVFTTRYITHTGEVLYEEKSDGEKLEYTIPIDSREYKVEVTVDNLLDGNPELTFKSSYTEEERNKILEKLLKYPTTYSLIANILKEELL